MRSNSKDIIKIIKILTLNLNHLLLEISCSGSLGNSNQAIDPCAYSGVRVSRLGRI
jgi:hypothetical protein